MIQGRLGGLAWKLVVSLVLVGTLTYRYAGDEAFRATLFRLDPWAFVKAEAVLAGGLVLLAIRWRLLLAAAGVSLGWGRSIRLVFVGYFFNLFLPTSVGGDVVRVLGVGQGARLSVVGSSVLVERFLGFACLLTIGLVASFTVPTLSVARNALLVAAAAFAGGTALLLFLPLPNWDGKGRVGRVVGGLRRTALEFRGYGFHPGALAAGAGLSLAWQLVLVYANVLLSEGLGGVATTRSLLGLVPVVQAVTMIPVSFGGLGVREMGYEYFFTASGFDPAGSVALAACFLGVTLSLALKGGVAYLVAPVRGREG